MVGKAKCDVLTVSIDPAEIENYEEISTEELV